MSNQAAWLGAKGARLNVASAPMPTPKADEVIIKSSALAINPVDWKIQDSGYMVQKWPIILGTDVAGEIVAVGDNVQSFKTGQRVLGHALALALKDNIYAGFQLYMAAKENVVAPIPDSLSFEKAVVLPLSISTASAGLYQKKHLALPYPSLNPQSTGKGILVWGGSSSVGSSAIQLAVASGIKVVATASSRNSDYVKSLGAHFVDYHSPDAVAECVAFLKETKFAGVYDAISEESTFKATFQIVSELGGGKICTVLPPPKDLPEGVKAASVMATAIALQESEIAKAVYKDFLPRALAESKFQAKPDPDVVGKGLGSIQAGMDKLKAGVSASKIVVSL